MFLARGSSTACYIEVFRMLQDLLLVWKIFLTDYESWCLLTIQRQRHSLQSSTPKILFAQRNHAL